MEDRFPDEARFHHKGLRQLPDARRMRPTSVSGFVDLRIRDSPSTLRPVQANVPVRVVIAEDSRLFQASLLALLAGVTGLRVVAQAYSGAEAIQVIQKERPQVVLLDLGLPLGDGFRVLEAFGTGDKPIFVVVTFAADEMVRERCRKLGAHFFHDKASDPEALLDFLSRLVEAGPPALVDARAHRGAPPEDFLTLQNT